MDQKGAIPKQQLQRIFISALLIIAIFIGTTRLRKTETKKEPSREDLEGMVKKIKVLEAEPLPRLEKVEYIASDLRDPFKGPFDEKPKEVALEKVELPQMTFQGMVFGKRISQAIIDNKVYKVGETVHDAEIVAITKEGIHLKYKGREFIVRPK